MTNATPNDRQLHANRPFLPSAFNLRSSQLSSLRSSASWVSPIGSRTDDASRPSNLATPLPPIPFQPDDLLEREGIIALPRPVAASLQAPRQDAPGVPLEQAEPPVPSAPASRVAANLPKRPRSPPAGS